MMSPIVAVYVLLLTCTPVNTQPGNAPHYGPQRSYAGYYAHRQMDSECQDVAPASCSGSNVGKWYYNSRTKFCERKLCAWGGMWSDIQCYRQCVCRLPPAAGDSQCSNAAKQQRYYFNDFIEECTPFTYNGCGGNGNNFQSFYACEAKCKANEMEKEHVMRSMGFHNERAFDSYAYGSGPVGETVHAPNPPPVKPAPAHRTPIQPAPVQPPPPPPPPPAQPHPPPPPPTQPPPPPPPLHPSPPPPYPPPSHAPVAPHPPMQQYAHRQPMQPKHHRPPRRHRPPWRQRPQQRSNKRSRTGGRPRGWRLQGPPRRQQMGQNRRRMNNSPAPQRRRRPPAPPVTTPIAKTEAPIDQALSLPRGTVLSQAVSSTLKRIGRRKGSAVSAPAYGQPYQDYYGYTTTTPYYDYYTTTMPYYNGYGTTGAWGQSPR